MFLFFNGIVDYSLINHSLPFPAMISLLVFIISNDLLLLPFFRLDLSSLQSAPRLGQKGLCQKLNLFLTTIRQLWNSPQNQIQNFIDRASKIFEVLAIEPGPRFVLTPNDFQNLEKILLSDLCNIKYQSLKSLCSIFKLFFSFFGYCIFREKALLTKCAQFYTNRFY